MLDLSLQPLTFSRLVEGAELEEDSLPSPTFLRLVEVAVIEADSLRMAEVFLYSTAVVAIDLDEKLLTVTSLGLTEVPGFDQG